MNEPTEVTVTSQVSRCLDLAGQLSNQAKATLNNLTHRLEGPRSQKGEEAVPEEAPQALYEMLDVLTKTLVVANATMEELQRKVEEI